MLRNTLVLSLVSAAALSGCLTSSSEESGAGLGRQCPGVMCALWCDNGFATGDDGCPICSCNPDPVECEPLACRMWCPNGLKQDENGCDMCECNDEPECPPVVCALWCPNGMKTDDNGCETCECNDEPTCEDLGGTCEVSPFDPGFAADCEGELGMDTAYGSCPAFNQSCCVPRDVPEGEPCGGFAGLTCDDDEYCAYEPDAMCGAADQMGTCAPRPEVCTQDYAPVCGCDGETHSNSCSAAAAGTSVAYDGECVAPPTDCRDDGCGRRSECQYCWGTWQCVPQGAMC